MSELYGHLSRAFLEVTPLYPQAKKSRARRKETEPSFFAEAAELVLLQLIPGVFVERAHTQVHDRPCFVVVDAPSPVLLPGTTADFAEAEFRYPAYQVPFHTGKAGGMNLDPSLPVRVAQGKVMALAQTLDGAIQRLLQMAATSGLPPAFAHSVVEKLRVWALEDYIKTDYLKTVAAVMTEITDLLYESSLPAATVKELRELVAEIRKATRALSAGAGAKPDMKEVFCQTWIQLIPALRADPRAQTMLRNFVEDPEGLREKVSSDNTPDLSVLAAICAKQSPEGVIIVNEGYSTFAQMQIG